MSRRGRSDDGTIHISTVSPERRAFAIAKEHERRRLEEERARQEELEEQLRRLNGLPSSKPPKP